MKKAASELNNVSLETRIVQGKDIFASDIDDEVVMANLNTDKYYGLNPVSTRIWHLIAEPTSVSDICTQLLTEFDIDEETCRNEVMVFVHELLNAEMAVIDSQ